MLVFSNQITSNDNRIFGNWETRKKIQSTALESQQAMNHTAVMLRGMRTEDAFAGHMLPALSWLINLGHVAGMPCCKIAKENRQGALPVQLLKANFEQNTLRCWMRPP